MAAARRRARRCGDRRADADHGHMETVATARRSCSRWRATTRGAALVPAADRHRPGHQGKGLGGALLTMRSTSAIAMARSPISIVEPAERSVVRTPWLRDPGPHPGRQLADPGAHAAQTTTEDVMLKGDCFCGAIHYETAARRRIAMHLPLHDVPPCRPARPWWLVHRAARPDPLRRWEPHAYRSSAQATRTFCRACGTPLTFESTRYPDEIDITTCSLDDPEQVPPRDHTRRRPTFLGEARRRAAGLSGQRTGSFSCR